MCYNTANTLLIYSLKASRMKGKKEHEIKKNKGKVTPYKEY